MRSPVSVGRAATAAALVLLVAACATRREAREPEPDLTVAVEGARDTGRIAVARPEAPGQLEGPAEAVTRDIPYEYGFGPSDPPKRVGGAMQKPIEPWVAAALDVWFERPSPKGPPPIPVAVPKAVYAVGKDPVIQVLPGPPAFPEKIPGYLQSVYPPQVPFSNNVKRLPRGDVRLVAYDRTLNDTKLSNDSMEFEARFTDFQGNRWRIEQVILAPISPNPIMEPWFGGLVIDTLYHGHTGNGTPAEPLVQCVMCSWGWADIYKNDQRVASSALLHVMVTSDVRAGPERNFEYMCYECEKNPVREVHIIVPPSAYLPAPGGFLHVMWENVELRRGPPDEITRVAPRLAEPMPTIVLKAAPYLTWDQKEIRVRAGQRYRLIVQNEDPSSFHQFHLHEHPAGEEHHAGGDLRHEHGSTAGGIGPLWKPGEAGHEQHPAGDPPAPAKVFFPLPQGSTWATTVMFEKPGRYEFMCPVGNHYRRGMEGYFVVEPADGSGTPVRKEGTR